MGRRLPLGLAAVVLVFAALALVWAGAGPASAQDDGEPKVPAKPGGLSVETQQGALDVAVDWDDVEGADDYLVRWRPHGPDQQLNEGMRPTSSDVKITVADYGNWVVRVQACNQAGCSGPVATTFEVEPAPDPTPAPTPEPTPEPTPTPQLPAQPAGLKVSTTAGSLDVAVDWDDVVGADHYWVRWRLQGPGQALNDGERPTASGAAITVADYGDWMVQAQACNDSGCSSPTVLDFSVAPPPPPAPAGLTATPESGKVTLAWTDPSDSTITRYQYRVSDDGGSAWDPDWTDISGTGASTTSHVVTGLTNAVAYTFELRAVAGTADGASASVGAMPAAPLVQNLNKRAVNQGDGTNTVVSDVAQAFTTGSNAAGYTLSYIALGVAMDAGAVEPTGYSVRVCDDSNSAPGDTCEDLSNPAALAAGGNIFTASGSGIDLDRDTTYWVVFDSERGGSGTVEVRRTADDGEDSVGETGWEIADDGLSRARASAATWDTGGNPHKVGVFGYARTGTTTAPAAPTNLKVANTDGQFEVAVTWDAAQGATSYRLEWRWISGSGARSAEGSALPGDSLEVQSAGASATVAGSGEWEFSLTACNDGGCGTPVVKRVEVDGRALKQSATATAEAGPDQRVAADAMVTLDGSGSSSTTQNATLTYAWTQTGGSRTVTLSSATAANPTFDAPSVRDDLEFSLTISDDEGTTESAADTVAVAVRPGLVRLVNQGGGCTQPGCPGAPTGSAEPGPGAGEITLHWNPAAGGTETDWEFTHSKAGEGGTLVDSIDTASSRTYVITGLDPGAIYDVLLQGVSGTLKGDLAGADNVHAGGAVVTGVSITSTPAVRDTYARGENIEVTVTWNTEVTWDLSASGADLTLNLDIGGQTGTATLVRGGADRGTARSLAFRYPVRSGDSDTDGIFPKPDANGDMVLPVGAATLRGAGNAEAGRKHAALAADAGHQVNGDSTAVADAGPDQEVGYDAEVTLDGTGSATTVQGADLTYAWTQTDGEKVTLDTTDPARPTFSAPSFRDDLEFSLTVNDEANNSRPDTVKVAVRPALNPTTAPCVDPAPPRATLSNFDLWTITATDENSISYRPDSTPVTQETDVYFCWPDGTREKHATGIDSSHTKTVSGLSSGTTYWIAAAFRSTGGTSYVWRTWQAVTTTGGASIVDVAFTSEPDSGDTYQNGETIDAQITWSQQVTVSNGGDNANVSLRLDLGADDADLTNSQRKMAWTGDGSTTNTLTFRYTVAAGDDDADGVWLQTAGGASDAIVFLENGAAITGGNPDTNNAVLTRADLPTSGDPTRKADGASTATADAGPDQEVRYEATVSLDGSGSTTTVQGANLTYAWTQTDGENVTLDRTNPARPTFRAPSFRDDLEFSLTVKDGTTSAPDTVKVAVRPALNPTTAPCAHPAPPRSSFGSALWDITATTNNSISYRPTIHASDGQELDVYFCWPDGKRDKHATGVNSSQLQTVGNLSSGTTYWLAGGFRNVGGTSMGWTDWVAVTTTGGASIVDAAFTTAPYSGDTYRVGETIDAQVTWSQPVTVSNGGDNANVSLRLDLGADDGNRTSNQRKMSWTGDGSTTNTLTFRYTVKAGTEDVDPDGIWLQTAGGGSDAIVFLENGATVTGGNPDTNNAVLTRAGLPTAGDPARRVEAGGAYITGVALTSTPASGDTYAIGEHIEVTVTWKEDVTWDVSAQNADLRVRLELGGGARAARLVRDGAETGTARSLVFRYTVARGDVDFDGVFPRADAGGMMVIPVNGATLEDAQGNDAALKHGALAADAGHKVHPAQVALADTGSGCDGTGCPGAPTGTALSGPGSGEITVNWTPATTGGAATHWEISSRLVGDTGAPSTELITDANARSHRITGREPGSAYEIEVRGINGTVNGDTARAGNVVAGGAAITEVAITSTPAGLDTYARGEVITVTVTWNTEVTWDVSAEDSDLRVRLDIGGATQPAKLVRGGATRGTARSLTFSRTVKQGDRDTDGIFPKPDASGNMALTVGDASLKGAGSAGAARKHAALPADAGHQVDGSSTAVADAGPDQEVRFDATVTLEGSGSSSRPGANLTYTWTQPPGQTIALDTSNPARPTFTAPSHHTDLDFSLVVNDQTNDSAADTVTVRVRPPLNPTSVPCAHPSGDNSSSTTLTRVIETTDNSIKYGVTGVDPGSVDLWFCRPDGSREKRQTGVAITHEETVINLDSGTRYWVALKYTQSGSNAVFWNGWKEVTTTGGASIRGVEFTTSPDSGDTYRNGETIEAQVTWSQPVTVALDATAGVNANVSLRLDLGADDTTHDNSQRKMAWDGSGGDGNGNTLTFEYTVVGGDVDADGIWLQADSNAVVFLENGATITGGNPDTNNAVLTRANLPTSGDASRKVDGASTATADAGEDQTVETGADPVTLDGSGSETTAQGATLTYEWTQTSGTAVTLDTTVPAQPTFTAPTHHADLEFSLTVRDGTISAPDTVKVTVRPGLNPATGPCVHPSGGSTFEAADNMVERSDIKDTEFSYRGSTAGFRYDLYFCEHDGTRTLHATRELFSFRRTVNFLDPGTTYWVAAKVTDFATPPNHTWTRWLPVTTTGPAQLLGVEFTSSPETGDTYGIGEIIRAQVTWSYPVTVALDATDGAEGDVSLRLDLGADDTDLTNSQRKMAWDGSGGDGTERTLTFEYTVGAGEMDADGVWLQTASSTDDAIVFLENSATLKGGKPVAHNDDAVLTKAGMSTSGDATRKVKGSATAVADAGPDQEVETGAEVTLSGSGSSSVQGANLTYQWTQTGGDSVELMPNATAQSPTFRAPLLTANPSLEFSLVVNDGNPSVADTVTVAVRPPLNPASAPCVHPNQDGELWSSNPQNLFLVSAITANSFKYRGDVGSGTTFDLWFCGPDGTRLHHATGVTDAHVETVSGLSSGTRHWIAVRATLGTQLTTAWTRWQAVTTTGGASLLDVEFTSSPDDGETYRIGEVIEAEVTWSQAVTVDSKGDDANVSLRLDVGADDTDRSNSQRKMTYAEGSGEDTLTFRYTVQSQDLDADGVWLQTLSGTDDTVVFLENGATLKGGNPNTNNAVRTRANMPTVGDAARKVDGSTTATADAGDDQLVAADVTVTLTGVGTSTLATPSYGYTWKQTGGTMVDLLPNATAQSPTFDAPSHYTDLVFSLVVHDGTNNSAADTVTVRVRPGLVQLELSDDTCTGNACPAAPAGTAVPGPDAGEITLEWTRGAGGTETQWEVSHQKDGETAPTSATINDASTRRHTFTGLAPGAAYDIFLRGINGSGNGDLTRAAGVPAGGAAITGVAIASTPAAGSTYAAGEDIEITVTWNTDVTWDLPDTGADLTVTLDIGGSDETATLVSGAASNGKARSLTFRYTVKSGDLDEDGIFPKPDTNGDMVLLAGDATLTGAGNVDAGRQHAALAADNGHRVAETTVAADAGEDQVALHGAAVQLAGSGSSVAAIPALTYAWTQTGGTHVTLIGSTAANPTFTAPTADTDLVFSLVVSDGTNFSAPDTVMVRVRSAENPSTAPCADLTGVAGVNAGLISIGTPTGNSFAFQAVNGGANDLYLCRPSGVSEKVADDKGPTHVQTVAGLASGTRYWAAVIWWDGANNQNLWSGWQAVATTGPATLRGVRFSSTPASGDTYQGGETIRAQATWSKPVTVTTGGSDANVFLRLDLGADDADRTNSRRKMAYASGSGTATLTFEYTVKSGEVDPDGIWLQTLSATDDTVVFLGSGFANVRRLPPSIRNVGPDTTPALRIRANLPASGDPTRKVDGTKTLSTSIALTLNPSALAESALATDVTVTATLNESARATDTTVALALDEANSTALKGTDYADPGTLPTITISGGSTSGTETISIDPTQDTLDEGSGETVRIGGTNPHSLTVTAADLTISDDDATPTVIDVSASPNSIDEDVGTATTVTVSARLRGDATRTVATTVDLNSTLKGTAEVGATKDYTHTALSASSITIPAESLTSTTNVTFDVTPRDDSDSEGTETILVIGTITEMGWTVNGAKIDLVDDDLPVVALSVDADLNTADDQTSLGEGAGSTQVKITATRDTGRTTDAVTVDLSVDATSTASGGTDYTALTGLPDIEIAENEASGSVTVSVAPRQDVTAEGDETIVFAGQVGDGTTFYVDSAELTITDDDTASTAITLSVNPTGLAESADSTTVTVKAALDDGAYATDTTVALFLDGGSTAAKGTDYVDPGTLPTITISAGETSGTETVSIDPTQDSIDEGDGEFVRIGGTHAGVTPVLPVSAADLTITDDDTASTVIDLSFTPNSVNESDGGTATTITAIKATLKGDKTRGVDTVVKLASALSGNATAGTGEDYTQGGTLPSGTITIPAAAQSKSVTTGFTITPLQDTLSEGAETILLAGAACQVAESTCPTGKAFTVNAAKISIVDDDLPLITLSVDVDGATDGNQTTVGEKDGSTTVTVTATRDMKTDVAVDLPLELGGTATRGAASGNDFTHGTLPTISFTAGDTSLSATFTIDPADDRLDEGAGTEADPYETIVVGGTAGDGTVFAVAGATITITDDDAPSDTVTLSVDADTGTDGAQTIVAESAGTATLRVSAEVDDAAVTAATVITLSVGGTAASGDCTGWPTTDPTFTIAKGETSAHVDIATFGPVQDDIDEGASETMIISATSATSANSAITTLNPATLTITDDDTASTVIDLSFTPNSVNESDGGTATTITAIKATLKGDKTRGVDTVVKLASALSGNATAGTGEDYTQGGTLPSGTITISAGTQSKTETTSFTITPLQDTLSEGTETILLAGAACQVAESTCPTGKAFTVNAAKVSIVDDDLPVVTLSLDPDSVGENAGSTQVRVTATRDTSRTTDAVAVSVTVGAAGSTAERGAGKDYRSAATVTVNIAQNAASGSATVTVTPQQDVTHEGDETIVFGGQVGDGTTFSVDAATLTVTDDDTASTAIALSVSPTSVAESAVATTVTVKATLNSGAYATDTTVALALDTVNSTATQGTDYAGLTGTLPTITIAAGETSGTKTISVNPTQDNIDEGTGETIKLTGTHAGVTPVLTVNAVDLTVSDDDATPTHVDLSASLSRTSLREDDTTAATVTVSARLQGDSTRTTDTVVNLNSTLGGTATAGAGKDYTHTALSPTSITIPKGQSSGSATVTFDVTPLQDTESEGTETILVSGTATNLTVNSAKVSLVDDDLPLITLSLDPASIGEADQSYDAELFHNVPRRQVTVTATRDTGRTTQAATVNLTVGAEGSTAVSDQDYQYLGDAQLVITIAENAASGSAAFSLELLQDRTAEGNETIVIGGAVGDGATFNVDPATLTLTDDDLGSGAVTLAAYSATIDESAGRTAVSVRAMLDAGASTMDTTVTLALDESNSTASKGADYVDPGTLPTITIPAGQVAGMVTVFIDPVQDNIDEGDGETIRISGTHSTGLPVSAAELTITDDDTATTIVNLSASPDSVAEDGSATTITVTASLAEWSPANRVWQPSRGLATHDTATKVTLNSALGGTATLNTDYSVTTALSPTSITIPAGQSSATASFSITTQTDTDVEGTETVVVSGSASGFTVNPATVSLVDDERPSITSVALVSTGPYKAGDTVRARVTFSEAVDVTGSPVLQLRFASNYGRKNMAFDTTKSLTNTTTLEFTYTVRPPNISTQGIAFYANQLTLPAGAAIRRTGTTVEADLAHARVDHNADHKVDALTPPLTRVSAFRSEVVLHYHPNLIWAAPPETLDANSVPAAGDFEVWVSGRRVSLASSNPVRISGYEVRITLAEPLPLPRVSAPRVTVTYRPGANPIRDEAGNEAPAFTNREAETYQGLAERTFLEAHTVDLFKNSGGTEHPWYTKARAGELRVHVLRAVRILEQIPVNLELHPDLDQIPGARYRVPEGVDATCVWVEPGAPSKCFWFYTPKFAATAWE